MRFRVFATSAKAVEARFPVLRLARFCLSMSYLARRSAANWTPEQNVREGRDDGAVDGRRDLEVAVAERDV